MSVKKYIKGLLLAKLRATTLRVENLPRAHLLLCLQYGICTFIVLRLCYPLKKMQKCHIICQKLIFADVVSWKNTRFISKRMTADMYEVITSNVKRDRLFLILNTNIVLKLKLTF